MCCAVPQNINKTIKHNNLQRIPNHRLFYLASTQKEIRRIQNNHLESISVVWEADEGGKEVRVSLKLKSEKVVVVGIHGANLHGDEE